MTTMAKKRTQRTSGKSSKKSAKKGAAKNSLVGNINKRKKAGTSRSKKDSTISPESYSEMKKGWPKAKRKRTTKKKSR